MVRKFCFATLAALATSVGCTVEMPTAQAPSGPSISTSTTPSSTETPPMPMPTGDSSSTATLDGGDGTMPVQQPDYSIPSSETPMSSGDAAATVQQPDSSIPSSENPPLSGEGTVGTIPDSSTVGTEGVAPMPQPNYGVPGSEGFPGQAAAAPPEKPFSEMTLLERSESSFKKGKETDAFRWLHAHAIASELDQAGYTLDTIRWVPGPKHPSLGVRFGIAVRLEAPLQLLASGIPAIGDSVPGLVREGEGQAAPAAAPARPTSIPKTSGETLRYFAGDLGVKILERLETRRSEGDWGETLKDLSGAGSMVAKAANDPYGMTGYSPPSDGGAPGAGALRPKGDTFELDLAGGDQISPGLVWLGFDTSGMAAARKAVDKGVDCVLFVDVKILVGRNAPPRNKTKITAMDVATAKPIANTGNLDSFEVYERRVKRPEAKDLIDTELDTLFEAIDETYAAQPMPEMTPEVALNRARALIADLPADPLPALAEMRYYRHAGLLDDAQYAIACKSLAPQDGLGETLASQDEAARKIAVEKLVESQQADDGSTDEKDDEKPADTATPAPLESALSP